MGLFLKWLENRTTKGPSLFEDKGPDYSLDRWVKMAQDLGGNIDSMVKDAKDKEKELDDKEKEAKKKPKPKSEVEPEDDNEKEKETLDITSDKNPEGSWNRLKQIAKERKEKAEKKESKNSRKNS